MAEIHRRRGVSRAKLAQACEDFVFSRAANSRLGQVRVNRLAAAWRWVAPGQGRCVERGACCLLWIAWICVRAGELYVFISFIAMRFHCAVHGPPCETPAAVPSPECDGQAH